MAAEWAGFTTVGQVEWADYPTKVLEKHWPDVPRWRDIRELTYDKFVERTGLRTVDLISGGFPCQPFSVAGKQKGKRDDRYLWPEMLRVISEIKPTWVLGENVPGILRIAGKTVCEDLEREGYAVTVFNFEAAAVGAPHRRDRVFFVANRQGGNEQEQQKCDNREEHKRRTQVRYGLGAGRGSKDGDSSERVEIGSGVTTEVSENVENTRCPLRQGGIIKGTDANEDREGTANITERPNCPSKANVADTNHTGNRTPTSRIDGNGQEKNKGWEEQPLIRTCRCGENVADTESDRRKCKAQQEMDGEKNCGKSGYRFDYGSKNVADTARVYVQGQHNRQEQGQLRGSCRRAVESDVGGVVDGISYWLDGYWRVEPDIPRVATGVKNRVDRLKCLGNAVVPQQVYPILKAIAEIETR